MANFTPLGERVVVKPSEGEQTTKGGIYLPDTAKEKPQEAQVVGLGTGGKDENGNDYKFTVKKKDKVLISKYGGTDIKIDGKDLLIVNEVDILAIIE